MLKEVLLGSGGIMLAAAIFASSMTPGTAPVSDASPPVVAPPPAARVATAPRPSTVFPEETGSADFGAPMVEASPVESGLADPSFNTAAGDSAEGQGRSQVYAKPGRPFPTPR